MGEASLKDPTALETIPAFPPIALRLLELVSGEDVALREVIELLRADAAFSAEILRRANSALFGAKQPINSLQHALVVLGLRRVQSLTMTVASGRYLKAALEIAELRRCWRHTLACALICEELARACSIHEDVAYTAGLMHNIGRLGLLVAHPLEYANLVKVAQQSPAGDGDVDLLDHEKEVFGMDHCGVGNYLAEQWGLPEEFRVVTGRHHDPPSGLEMDLLALVYLGCQLADGLGFDVVRSRRARTLEEIREALPPAAQRRFHRDAEELRQFVETRIDALDIVDLPAPTAQPEEPKPEQPVQEAQPAAPAARPAEEDLRAAMLKRDIMAAMITAVVGMGLFFLVVRLLSG
jgi:HD-like signal output (HDOD) protein